MKKCIRIESVKMQGKRKVVATSSAQKNSFHTPATYVHPVCWPDYREIKPVQK